MSIDTNVKMDKEFPLVDMNTAMRNYDLGKSLVSVSSNLKLYGCLLYKFDIDVIDNDNITAFVSIDRSNTLIMRFGKRFLQTRKNANEVAFVIIHEISHVLRGDLTRGVGLRRDIYNIAADHVLNTAIKEDIDSRVITDLDVPQDALFIHSLLGRKLTTEEVYQYLMDHAEISTETISLSGGTKSKSGNTTSPPSRSGNQDNTDSTENREDDDVSEDDSTNDRTDSDTTDNNHSNTEGDNRDSSDTDDSNDKSSQDDLSLTITKTTIKLPDGQVFTAIQDIDVNSGEACEGAQSKLQADARRLLNSSILKNKLKGDKPGSLLSMIEDSIKVEIPWQDLLEKVIKQNIAERSDNKTWRNINKRMYSYDLILPTTDFDEQVDKLYIVVDTSGSISDSDLMKFFDILKQSMYHFKNIVKIDHDTRIDNIQLFTSDSFSLDALRTIGFGGRGGTSHRNVYDYIEAVVTGNDTSSTFNGQNPDTESEPGLVIFLTDFCSDIESIHSNYTWVKDIPYKYILSGVTSSNIPAHIDDSPIIVK